MVLCFNFTFCMFIAYTSTNDLYVLILCPVTLLNSVFGSKRLFFFFFNIPWEFLCKQSCHLQMFNHPAYLKNTSTWLYCVNVFIIVRFSFLNFLLLLRIPASEFMRVFFFVCVFILIFSILLKYNTSKLVEKGNASWMSQQYQIPINVSKYLLFISKLNLAVDL